jgi:predicted ArsR family transcriptional regulator
VGVDIRTPPGDVLSQPTRARLFELLSDLRRPAGTEELAAQLGLHPNGVRLHLEALRTAGLVERERERRPRGRPRDRWSISPTALPGGDAPTGYADLGRFLLEVIAAGGLGAREVEAAGREIGRALPPADDASSGEQRMHAALTAMGFAPQRSREPAQPGQPERLTYCLRNCPYRDVVRDRQPIICGLHRGITLGMLDTIDPKTKLNRFVPKDPDEAGCLIELRGPMVEHVPA